MPGSAWGPPPIPLLSAIEEASGTIFAPGSIPENVLQERVPLARFEAAREQGGCWLFLIPANTRVGFAFWQEANGAALLALIEVHPLHGQRGLGAALGHRL